MPGCDADSDSEGAETDQLELFSWWTSAGEGAALDALLNIYTQDHPDVRISNIAADTSLDAQQELDRRMAAGLPPDLVQRSGGLQVQSWASPTGTGVDESTITSLDELADAGGWRQVIPSLILDAVSVDGEMFAVPLNIHRLNCLFYNKKIFEEQGLEPPTNVDEFLVVADALQGAGIAPLALGLGDKWPVQTTLWENMLLGELGSDFWYQYLQGDSDPRDERMRNALVRAAEMLEFVDVNAAKQTGWADAAASVANGFAAMNFMGDWAKGEFVAADKSPDDYGVVNWGGAYVANTDGFVVPIGLQNEQNALDLAVLMGSTEGQEAFNPGKGSIPSRSDADPSVLDAISQAAFAEFHDANSTLLPAMGVFVPSGFSEPVGDAMVTFVEDKNVDNLLTVMANHYGLLME